MPKQMVEIDVPDGCIISKIVEEDFHTEIRFEKDNWTPPRFLKPGWIAMEKSGEWWWYSEEPVIKEKSVIWESGGAYGEFNHFNWTPPYVSDWKQSKRRIP